MSESLVNELLDSLLGGVSEVLSSRLADAGESVDHAGGDFVFRSSSSDELGDQS